MSIVGPSVKVGDSIKRDAENIALVYHKGIVIDVDENNRPQLVAHLAYNSREGVGRVKLSTLEEWLASKSIYFKEHYPEPIVRSQNEIIEKVLNEVDKTYSFSPLLNCEIWERGIVLKEGHALLRYEQTLLILMIIVVLILFIINTCDRRTCTIFIFVIIVVGFFLFKRFLI